MPETIRSLRDSERTPPAELGLKAVLDTRRPAGNRSGFRVGMSAAPAVDVTQGFDRSWIHYGGGIEGSWDVTGTGRVLSLGVIAMFADPLGSQPVPFNELVTVGGAEPFTGFLNGRLRDRSAIGADLTWRELRGSRVLGAWVNHHDARSQNTLAMWIDDGDGKGHIEHDILDWGDTLGGLMDWDSVSRLPSGRLQLLHRLRTDWTRLRHLWRGAAACERAKIGPAGKIFGYFDDAEFEPEEWHVGYPNVAFSSMQESEGAWMARIISHLDDAAIEAIVNEAKLSSPIARSELIRILRGRRDRILQRYLLRLSSLERPTLADGRVLVRLTSLGEAIPGSGNVVCVTDRAEAAGLGAAPEPSAKVWYSSTTAAVVPISHRGRAELCVAIPDLGGAQRVLDISTGRPGQGPLRAYVQGGDQPRPGAAAGRRAPARLSARPHASHAGGLPIQGTSRMASGAPTGSYPPRPSDGRRPPAPLATGRRRASSRPRPSRESHRRGIARRHSWTGRRPSSWS
jgi:hypothetical protein